MSVVLNKKKLTGHLTCDHEGCTNLSSTYRASSPAAPELTICEQAGTREGWGYDIGFYAMLRGHTTFCPSHK